jgi:hypothetical protein
MSPRLCGNIFEIDLEFADCRLLGDRVVAGHDDIHVEAEDVVASVDPVADWPRPEYRMAADEQQIAGEQDPVGRHVDGNVVAGMRRAEMRQYQPFVLSNTVVGGVLTNPRQSKRLPMIS